MKKLAILGVILGCLATAVLGHTQDQRLKIASTTSTDNTGLFEALNPPFEKMFLVRVDVIPQGTGKALKTGEMGDCDVVFVHSRPAEDRFVEAVSVSIAAMSCIMTLLSSAQKKIRQGSED